MNTARHSFTAVSEVRVTGKHFGGLLGPEFDVTVGDKSYRVGALTLKLLQSGTSVEDLDLLEIDPDTQEDN